MHDCRRGEEKRNVCGGMEQGQGLGSGELYGPCEHISMQERGRAALNETLRLAVLGEAMEQNRHDHLASVHCLSESIRIGPKKITISLKKC
jgi:hypothetical protein